MSANGRLSVFVDAGILLCSEDGVDTARQARAIDWLAALWQRRAGRLSTQVLDTFYVMATRQMQPPMPAGDARAEVRRYALWQPWRVDHATVESAWAIESRYGLDYPGSLLVAAAQHLGCRYLLSEALPHAHHFGGVQVINPFNTSIDLLDTPQ